MNGFLQLSRQAFHSLHGLDVDPESTPVIDPAWFDAARRNRVVGLWADSAGAVPVGEEWHRYAVGQMLHSARLTAEAVRIQDTLKGSVEGLRLVKGPALDAQAWPRPGLRCYDDLDFRCAKHSLDALTCGLQSLGYLPMEEPLRRRENLWYFGWGIGFRHPDGFMVEFNHRMFPPHYPWPDRLTSYTPELWSSLKMDRHLVECPVPALHLLLSCVHAIWHGWERLGWLADIAGLLVRHPGVLPAAEELAARNHFLHRALQCGCGVADKIFGPLPGAADFGTTSDPLVDQALVLLMRIDPSIPVHVQRQIHHQLMRPREEALYTLRRLLTPGDPDFRQWSLSAGRRGLYWPLRPVRYLFGKIGG